MSATQKLLRFGVFELNLASEELRKSETVIKLPPQPFKLLALLASRAGQVVSREEIQQQFWGDETEVDAERRMNQCIKQIRTALGDDAAHPLYIETAHRHGYRFIAPVESKTVAAPSPKVTESDSSGVESAIAERVLARIAETREKPPAQAPADSAAPGLGPRPSVLSGRTVSHYRVLDVIGGGGMGVVYRAEDMKLGRPVALKFLPEELGSDPQALERFSREARAASSLDHPNICSIFEFGEQEGRPFIVMQLLEGQTLRDHLAEAAKGHSTISTAELLDIAIQVSDGLQAAHQRGIIHRDIKPANIFLTSAGVVKILDFGLAKRVLPGEKGQAPTTFDGDKSTSDEAGNSSLATTVEHCVLNEPRSGLQPAISADPPLTLTGPAMGTAGYMSPEQVRGEKLDARTDLFSFGLVLYEMATGERAFTGETDVMVRDAIVNTDPIPAHELNAELPQEAEGIISKALEKDREQRYQSVAEMRAELKQTRQSIVPGRKVSSRWKWLAVAALILAIAAGVGLYWRAHNTIKLTAEDTIVLADLGNQTSDPVFDDALNTALRVEMEQTPFLNVLTADKVRGTLKLLNHPEDAKLTPELAREVCLRTNSKAVVASSIADAGNHFQIELRGLNCKTGRTFAQTQLEAADRNDVVRVLGVAGGSLRRQLGEAEASLINFNKPLEEATSPSLEALRFLAEGIRHHASDDFRGALPYYNRAVQLDPNFALVYIYLGTAHNDLGDAELGAESEKKAFQLRDRLTKRSRFLAEATYYLAGTGELEKSCQVHMQWLKIFPTDVVAHIDLSDCLAALGQYEEAAAEAREATRLMPTALTFSNLMAIDAAMNRLDEARAAFDEARTRKIDGWLLRENVYLIGFLQHDEATMQEQLNWARGKVGIEDLFLSREGRTEAYFGRFRSARQLSQQAVDLARRAGPSSSTGGSPAGYRAAEALREAEVGNSDQAHRAAAEATVGNQDRDTKLASALAFARVGDVKRAQELADEVDKEFPLDTLTQNYCLPTIRAAMKLHQNDPAGAIETLQSAARFDLASPDCFSNLYPAYVRGLAYLDAGQGRSAATEFQKVLEHPGIMRTFVTGALAHLQMGRAQAMMGNKEAARKSYEDFLTLWKDADPDIPILRQAKAEYAKLQ